MHEAKGWELFFFPMQKAQFKPFFFFFLPVAQTVFFAQTPFPSSFCNLSA